MVHFEAFSVFRYFSLKITKLRAIDIKFYTNFYLKKFCVNVLVLKTKTFKTFNVKIVNSKHG